MGMFDDLPDANQGGAGGGLFDDIPTAKPKKNRFADWTPDQIEEYRASKLLQDASPGGMYDRRLQQGYSLGGMDELTSAGNTLLDVPSMIRSGRFNPVERFKQHQQVQEALNDDMRGQTDGTAKGVAADVIGGLAMGVPSKVAAGIEAAAPTLWGTAKSLAGYGAGYGAVGGFLGTDGDLETRASNVPGAAAEGAVNSLLLGGAIGAGYGARQFMRNRAAARSERNIAAAQDFREAGVPEFGPAITDSPTQAATAGGIAKTPFGAPLREAAGESITGLNDRLATELRRPVNGLSQGDLGQDIQGTLKNNIYAAGNDRALPPEVIDSMTPQQLERYTGPVGPGGFRPPRPQVEPVPPAEVQPVKPRDVGQVHVDPVQPDYDYVPFKNVQPPTELAQEHAKQVELRNSATETYNSLADQHNTTRIQIKEDLTRNGITDLHYEPAVGGYVVKLSGGPGKGRIGQDYIIARPGELGQAKTPGQQVAISQAMDWLNSYDKAAATLQQHVDTVKQANSRISDLESQMYNARVVAHREQTSRMQAEAERIAQNETATKKVIAQSAAEARARQEAEQQTNRAKEVSRRQAEAATADNQRAADAEWEKSTEGFRAGREQNKELTYPDEFGAAYERANAEVPKWLRYNILGQKATKNNPGETTNTAELLKQFGIEARGRMQMRGFKEPFDDLGKLDPALYEHLKQHLGPEVSRILTEYANDRAMGRLSAGPEGMKGILSLMKREIRDQELRDRNPMLRGEARSVDTQMLKRLVKSVQDDITEVMSRSDAGRKGWNMIKDVDSAYADHVKAIREPLAKVTNEKDPLNALNKLADAAKNGNHKLLRAYVRVMAEKDDPVKAAAAIIGHMAGPSPDLATFLKTFGKMSRDTREVLFQGGEGHAYRSTLEQLERVAQRLAPYTKAAAQGAGMDLTKIGPSHIGLALGLYHWFWPTLIAGGGMNAAARFMASPRYVRWLTQAPQALSKGPPASAVANHLGRLAAITQHDSEAGNQILKAAKETLIPSARAEYVGEGAQTADKDALKRAQSMMSKKVDPKTIWNETGWFQGKDKKWRSYLSDADAQISSGTMNKVMKHVNDFLATDDDTEQFSAPMELSNVLSHSALLKAYPDLSSLPVFFERTNDPYDAYLRRDIEGPKIIINATKLKADTEKSGEPNAKELTSTLLHELQHYIQWHEKFDYGPDPKNRNGKSVKDWDYSNLPGEREAFATEKNFKGNALLDKAYPPDVMRRPEPDPDYPFADLPYNKLRWTRRGETSLYDDTYKRP